MEEHRQARPQGCVVRTSWPWNGSTTSLALLVPISVRSWSHAAQGNLGGGIDKHPCPFFTAGFKKMFRLGCIVPILQVRILRLEQALTASDRELPALSGRLSLSFLSGTHWATLPSLSPHTAAPRPAWGGPSYVTRGFLKGLNSSTYTYTVPMLPFSTL